MANATPGSLYPREEDPVPIAQETGWDPRASLDGCGVAHKILELEERKCVCRQDTCVFTNNLKVLFRCAQNQT